MFKYKTLLLIFLTMGVCGATAQDMCLQFKVDMVPLEGGTLQNNVIEQGRLPRITIKASFYNCGDIPFEIEGYISAANNYSRRSSLTAESFISIFVRIYKLDEGRYRPYTEFENDAVLTPGRIEGMYKLIPKKELDFELHSEYFENLDIGEYKFYFDYIYFLPNWDVRGSLYEKCIDEFNIEYKRKGAFYIAAKKPIHFIVIKNKEDK